MADADESPVLFRKASDSDNQDVWDDSLVMQAYEEQQRMVEKALKAKTSAVAADCQAADPDKTETATALAHVPLPQASSKVRRVSCEPPPIHCGTLVPRIPGIFAVGDACRCVYSADGVEYEAEIVEVFPDRDQCLVRYVGYENEELRTLSKMKPSHGQEARVLQTQESAAAAAEAEDLAADLLQLPSSPEPDIEPASSRADVRKVINSIASHAADSSGRKAVQEKKKMRHRHLHDRLTNESVILPYRKRDSSETAAPANGSPTTDSRPAASAATAAAAAATTLSGFSESGKQPRLCPPPMPPGLLSGRTEEDEALASMLMSWYVSGYHTGYYEAMKKYRSSS